MQIYLKNVKIVLQNAPLALMQLLVKHAKFSIISIKIFVTFNVQSYPIIIQVLHLIFNNILGTYNNFDYNCTDCNMNKCYRCRTSASFCTACHSNKKWLLSYDGDCYHSCPARLS